MDNSILAHSLHYKISHEITYSERIVNCAQAILVEIGKKKKLEVKNEKRNYASG